MIFHNLEIVNENLEHNNYYFVFINNNVSVRDKVSRNILLSVNIVYQDFLIFGKNNSIEVNLFLSNSFLYILAELTKRIESEGPKYSYEKIEKSLNEALTYIVGDNFKEIFTSSIESKIYLNPNNHRPHVNIILRKKDA